MDDIKIKELQEKINKARAERFNNVSEVNTFKKFSDIEVKETKITDIVKNDIVKNDIVKNDIEENITKDTEITKSDIEESTSDKSLTDKNVNDVVEIKEQKKEKKKNDKLAFLKKNGRNDVVNTFINEPLKMYKDKGVFKTERFYQSPKQITDFLIMWGQYKHTLPLYIIFFDLWKYSKLKNKNGEKYFKFSYQKMCNKFNIKVPKPLQNAINELVELNLIRVEQAKKGSSNTYYLVFQEIKTIEK